MTQRALKAYESLKENGIKAKIIGVSSPLSISKEDLQNAASTGYIITYEDHNIHTGLGNTVAEKLLEYGISVKGFKKIGVSKYGASGKADEVYKDMGIDEKSLVNTVTKLIS